MEYDLELDRVAKKINDEKAKIVCIQLPAGLKTRATAIASYLEENTSAQILIWFNSNFGACDIPLELQYLPIDLLVHFGHSQWRFADTKST